MPALVVFVASWVTHRLFRGGERVAVPPEGDKSPHVWQERWSFGAVAAAAGLSTFPSQRLPLRPALRAKLAPPCGFGSATRIFFLRSAITYPSRG
jgi:hypothetical protein